ncbi:MAG: ComEC/Rec2 family competence protein [Deferrisomatales bacterium]
MAPEPRRPRAWQRPLLFSILLCLVGGALVPQRPLWGMTLALAGGAAGALSFRGPLPRGAAALALGAIALAGARGIAPQTPALPLGKDLHLRGLVIEDPRPGADGPRVLVDLRASAGPGSEWKDATGRVLLQVLGDPTPPPALGDVAVFRSRLRPPTGPVNPGGGGYPAYLERKGVTARASAKWPGTVSFARPGEGSPGWMRLRQRLGSALSRAVPGPEGGVLRALALGERSSLPPETAEAFRRCGTAHLVAISGLHLGMLALLLTPPLRALLVRVPLLPLAHPVPLLARALTLPFLAAYAALSGFQVSTLRALVMVGLLLLGTALSRPVAFPALLAATAIVLGVGSPRALGDPGLHLSLAAVAGLFWLAPRLEAVVARPPDPLERVAPPGAWLRALRRAGRGLRSLACASTAAAVATAPVSAYHFGGSSILGLAMNPVAVPLVGFFCLPLALLGAAAEALWPGTGGFAWKPAGVTLSPLLWLQGALVPLAQRLTLPGLSSLLAVGAAACLVAALGMALQRPRPRGLVALALAGVLGLTVPEAARGIHTALRRDAELWVFDVGSGLAVGLRLPGGHWAVVDGAGFPGSTFDPGERIVVPALSALGGRGLTLAISTHPHPDHLIGLPALVAWGRPEEVWLPGSFEGDPRYVRLLAAAEAAGSRVLWLPPEGRTRGFGAAKVEARWFPETRENDRSLAVRVECGGTVALIPADLESAGLARLAASDFPARCDLLLAPHHGAANAVHMPFLQEARPQITFISAGGRPGLPAPVFLDSLDALGIPACSTHQQGFLHARLGARGLQAHCGPTRDRRVLGGRDPPAP